MKGSRSPRRRSGEAIRKATVGHQVVPVLCGSAFKNRGVQPLLDAIVDYLPSPLDVPAIEGTSPDGERSTDALPMTNPSQPWPLSS